MTKKKDSSQPQIIRNGTHSYKDFFPEVDKLSIEEFLLEDVKKKIENQFMNKDGWLTIFSSKGIYPLTDNIIAQFIPENNVEDFLKSPKWTAKWGINTTPIFNNIDHPSDSKEKSDENIYLGEFTQLINLSSRSRPDEVWKLRVDKDLIDGLNLEDQANFTGRPKRDFCIRNKEGNLTDVLNIKRWPIPTAMMDSSVLSHYLSEKKLKLAICFYVRRTSSCPDNWVYEPIENIQKTSQYIYKHSIKKLFPRHRLSYIIDSDICGKMIIEPKK